jgi:DNA-binding MarR family transcriptional regulator
MRNNPKEDCARKMYRLIPHIKRYMSGALPENIDDIPRHLYPALLFLYHCGKKNMSAIAAHIGTSKPLITQQTDRLIELGLAEKTYDDGDRRTASISLTSKGKKAAEKTSGRFVENGESYLSGLSDEDATALSSSLDGILDILGKLREKK